MLADETIDAAHSAYKLAHRFIGLQMQLYNKA